MRNLVRLSPLLVLFGLIAGYPRLRMPRRASAEGIEDPAMARAYDRVSRMPQFMALRRLIVRKLAGYLPEGTRQDKSCLVLVDIGCGPGYLLATIAQTLPHLWLVGVDISQEMVDRAARNLQSLGLGKRAEFRVGGAQQLPLAAENRTADFPSDESVDFIVSTLSLHHWSSPGLALAEMQRVLKPGGQLLLFDLRRDARRAFYWLLRFAQAVVVPRVMRRAHEPTNSLASAYTPGEVEAMLRSTPFQRWRIDGGVGWMFVWGMKATAPPG